MKNKNDVFKSSGLIISGSLIVLLLILGCDTSKSSPPKPSQTQSLQRPEPAPIRLVVSEQNVFFPEALRGGDKYFYVSGHDGQVWALKWTGVRPLMASKVAGTASGLGESLDLLLPSWTVAVRLAVGNDDEGNPIVAMWVNKEGPEPNAAGVFVRRYYNGIWEEPTQLEPFVAGGNPFGDMVMLLDSQGRLHVLYDRELTPPEDYSLNFIIAEGAYADKCFHAFMDKGKWTHGAPMTDRGRFSVRDLTLEERADGRIRATMLVHPFSKTSYLPEYTGYQDWDGTAWSDLQPLPPEAITADEQSMPDYWGNRILWYVGNKGEYECVTSKDDNSTSAEAIPLLSQPVMSRDRQGRIFACSWNTTEAELLVWNGSEWGGTVKFPIDGAFGDAEILCNPDGNVYVLLKNKTKVLIQRVSVLPVTEE